VRKSDDSRASIETQSFERGFRPLRYDVGVAQTFLACKCRPRVYGDDVVSNPSTKIREYLMSDFGTELTKSATL
jgi:hypothetical protein